MALNTYQLEALEAVARLKNFTTAAVELRVTQPALTRRIQALEAEVGGALFLRKPGGLELTATGAKVLSFAESVKALESGLKEDLMSEKEQAPVGLVRFGGYSSALQIVVTPTLSPLLRAHKQIQLHYLPTQDVYPYEKLGDLLKKSDVDFLVSVRDYADREIVSHRLGFLDLVAVESKKYKDHRDTYLDTRPGDRTTETFLQQQTGKTPCYQRTYLHDEVGILDATAEGMGRSVVYAAFAKKEPRVKLVKEFKAVQWPIYFHYRRQPFYSKLATAVIDTVLANAAKHMDGV